MLPGLRLVAGAHTLTAMPLEMAAEFQEVVEVDMGPRAARPGLQDVDRA